MEIYVLKTYDKKLLNVIGLANRMRLGSFIIIGDVKKINNVCLEEEIMLDEIEIIDAIDDNEIIKIMNERNNSLEKRIVINGDMSNYCLKKALSQNFVNDYNYINIIDLPYLKHFLFVTNFNQKNSADFNKKKKAIYDATNIMNLLGIKKINASLVAYNKNRIEELESNIIKMIIDNDKDQKINLLGSQQMYDLLSPRSVTGIHNCDINLVILDNYDATKIFIDTLLVYANCKIASIFYSDNFYMIDTKSDNLDKNNMLFTILIINKLIQREKSFCDSMQLMV